MDRETAINIANQYAKVVAGELNPSAIFLYGSYANDKANKNSDIDVAVIFNGFYGNWLKTSAKLWKLRRDISDDIEPILLDLTKDPSGFVNDIIETGEMLYKEQTTLQNH
jgi:predicted nucleotidyltransferase